MNQADIFLPFFLLMILTTIVWFYMYAKRIPFIQSSKLTPAQLSPAEFNRLSPPEISNPSDNLKNLFELPAVFYALVLYLFTTNNVDGISLAAAWIFVVFRILHSLIHCTINIIMLRFALYCISAMTLWLMVAREAWGVFI
ncbi:MAG: MAPEG family protein [Pseudomonadales bacterium]|nr:MAPEG family protein [Pseudomonadales bacterium]